MFPAMYTHYYWEEKREEIYRSAPTRTRLTRGRRGGARRARGGRTQEREEPLVCLSHGEQWAGHYDQLMEGLCGRVLPNRPGFRDELAATVCSCDDRDKEKCRDAADRFGFTAGSNLPPLELNNRMRFTELYFHNILNSPQFTQEYIENASQEDPVTDIVQGLHTARTVIYALVQRCVLSNDLKAYRLLDIIRLYVQKPNSGRLHLPLPTEEEAALEMLFMLEKGDHMNLVAKLFGCQIVLGLSSDSSPPTLDLNLSTANLNDVKGVEEYFQDPIGYKEPPPKPVVEEEPSEASTEPSAEASGDEAKETAEPNGDTQPEGDIPEAPKDIQESPEDSQGEGQDHPQADSPTSGTPAELPIEVVDSTAEQPLDSNTATDTPVTGSELTSEQTSESSRTTADSTSEISSSATTEVQLSDSRDSEQAISTSNKQTNFSGDTISDGPAIEQMATDETGSVTTVSKDTSDMQTFPMAVLEESQSKEMSEISPELGQPNTSEIVDNAMQTNIDPSLTTNSALEILA